MIGTKIQFTDFRAKSLQTAVVVCFVLGSTAFAMGSEPSKPLPSAPSVGDGGSHVQLNGFAANANSAIVGYPATPGWGPGRAWGDFPGSLNANGS